MSLQIAENEQSFSRSSPAIPANHDLDKSIKVLIPYDGSECAERSFDDLRRAGLPEALEAIVAVTNVWLPLSPDEITRAVSARRMKVLTAGASSFAPAFRDHEERRVLSLEAARRLSSIFPLGTVRAEALEEMAAVANEILLKAKQWGAELIILGSNTSPSPNITDYSGPALKVAREAHCSVRIARASERRDGSPIRIVLGVDGSAAATHVVDTVADRVWPEGTVVRLVAVHKGGPRDPRKESETSFMLERAAQRLRTKELRVSTAIRDWKPQDVLLEEARELAADCIFIDAHGFSRELGESDERRGLGTVAEALSLGAQCSVEIVRAKNPGHQYLKPAA